MTSLPEQKGTKVGVLEVELQSGLEHEVSGLQKAHEHDEKDEDTVKVDCLDSWRPRIKSVIFIEHFTNEVYYYSICFKHTV